ncbi:succinyldiaminopimelate transaminase [Alkalilimnicola ehrlichii]|uniref:Succinyldiaminopimelate transaminase n=1 Tax=Alkalilimnicola ehrlichii TaxID=351052 RepID=A0A3E0WS84_9GAMM|nr:succinyldiaminopimelate transaminase [Alkalilimnicola ehrlichii]RFA28243.1 succinyldiaminopimelate transaminase [Alkalilimnicola ehrlichii]RFA34845.1 succinyldiaminopimelate transaminase [Alkalilimnicola ehrlichii]
MNPKLDRLLPYPFERLNALKGAVTPPTDKPHISLAIGEPQHAPPHWLTETFIAHAHGLSHYPSTKGGEELRTAICAWLAQRFQIRRSQLDPERQVLPVNGTREALFAFAQAVVEEKADAMVLMPNPGYQIYEGACLLAGASPHYMPLTADGAYLPDFGAVPEHVWQRCQLIYICNPGNPTGALMPTEQLAELIALSDRHDFVIAADECYSELYQNEDAPPVGLLQVCAQLGRDDYRNCVVFHSLSKRSNVPGLRSGFVAGDAAVLERFLLYRTYHGSAMPLHVQTTSRTAWADERHVAENRMLYRQKFAAVGEILAPVLTFEQPPAGFYLWPRTPLPDTEFAQRLYATENVTVLPGSFLSRTVNGHNPGTEHVRLALVASEEDCIEAARRIRRFIENLSSSLN